MKTKVLLSSFSRKILSKDFGQSKLGLDTGEIRALCSLHKIKSDDSRLSLLTDLTEIDVSSSLTHIVTRFGQGIHLHYYHLDRMMHFIYAHVISGEVLPYVSIRKFYEFYDLEFEDYDIDAAYRRWQRFLRRKKDAKKDEIPLNYICKKTHIYTVPEVESLISKVFLSKIDDFISNRNHVKIKYLKQIRVMTYHSSGYSVYEINKMLGYPTSTIRTIIRRMKPIWEIYGYRDLVARLTTSAS